MKFCFAFLVVICSLTLASGQEVRYFTPYFQIVSATMTQQERRYTLKTDTITIADYQDGTLTNKGIICGAMSLDRADEFTRFSLSDGNVFYYKDYFASIHGFFESYASDGTVRRQRIVRNKVVKYAQVWNSKHEELLHYGNGEHIHANKAQDADYYEIFRDSLMVKMYEIRRLQKDTIYYIYDQIAAPKEGMQAFYQKLTSMLRYPKGARTMGVEGRVYVEFLVDEMGDLREFKALTTEGYHFEEKAIKKLEKLRHWNPAVYNGRFVKTKFVLPIVFKLI